MPFSSASRKIKLTLFNLGHIFGTWCLSLNVWFKDIQAKCKKKCKNPNWDKLRCEKESKFEYCVSLFHLL